MSYVKERDKNTILDEMTKVAQPGTQVHEQQKAAIIVRCTEDIESSLRSLQAQLNENSESSDRLGKKIFWLNVVLTIATGLGALATGIIAFKT